MNKKRICLSLPKGDLTRMEKIKQETGVSVSKQIELALKGYGVCKVKEGKDNERKTFL